MVFHHNDFTILLCIAAIYALYQALSLRNIWLSALAGGLVAVNIFTRLPNASMMSLVLAFIPFYLYTKDINQTIKLLCGAIVGFVVGMGIQIGMMVLLDHWDIFANNFTSAGAGQLSAEESAHNVKWLILKYCENYWEIIICAAELFVIPFVLSNIPKVVHAKLWQRVIVGLMAVFYICVIWINTKNPTMISYAFAYLILSNYALQHKKDEDKIYIIIMALIMMSVLPFGSASGILTLGLYCIWISIPLAVGLVYDEYLHHNHISSNSYKNGLLYGAILIFLSVLSLRGMYQTGLECYFDPGSRVKKMYRINHSLATTYTTEKRCAIVNDLLEHLKDYVNEGDYLLAYYGVPTVHYLTHTYPYLNCSWPSCYDIGQLKQHFKCAEENIDVKPVILRHKSGLTCWTQYNPEWNSLNCSDQWLINADVISQIQSFIVKYDYEVVWENDLWQILITKDVNRIE